MRRINLFALCLSFFIAAMFVYAESQKATSITLGDGSKLPITPKEQIPSNIPAEVREKILSLYSASPFYRFEAVRSLGEMHNRALSATPWLIDLLGDKTLAKMVSGGVETKVMAEGQFFLYCGGNCFYVDDEAEKALCNITGQSFGKDQTKWRGWWGKNKQILNKKQASGIKSCDDAKRMLKASDMFFSQSQPSCFVEKINPFKDYGTLTKNQYYFADGCRIIPVGNLRPHSRSYVCQLCSGLPCYVSFQKVRKTFVDLKMGQSITVVGRYVGYTIGRAGDYSCIVPILEDCYIYR